MLRDASQRTWAVEAVALTWRCDAPQHEGGRARRILAERGRSSFDQTKRSGRMRVRSKGRTNLGLYEITAGSASLFPACYLQGTPQLQRVEPSARGPPTFRLPQRRPVFSRSLQERRSRVRGTLGTGRCARVRARAAPRAPPTAREVSTTAR